MKIGPWLGSRKRFGSILKMSKNGHQIAFSYMKRLLQKMESFPFLQEEIIILKNTLTCEV